MKPATIITACAALFGVLAPVGADDGTVRKRAFGNGVLSEHLAMYDVDRNGKLSEEEMQVLLADRDNRNRHRRFRDRWDTNRDGRISPEEREAARIKIRRAIIQRRSERFDAVDLDQNGILAWEEFKTISAVADTITTVNDLTDDSQARRLFEHLNRDGRPGISKDEFLRSLEATRPVGIEPAPTPKPHDATNDLGTR